MMGSADSGLFALLPMMLAVAGVLSLFWWLARATRKRFRCPSCGEELVVEQLDAKRCPTCGAALGPGESV